MRFAKQSQFNPYPENVEIVVSSNNASKMADLIRRLKVKPSNRTFFFPFRHQILVLTSVILVLYSGLCPDILTFSHTAGRIFIHMSRWTIFSLWTFNKTPKKIKIVTWNLVQRWIANWLIFWTTKLPVACRGVHGNREMILQWRKNRTSEKKKVVWSEHEHMSYWTRILCHQPGHKSIIRGNDLWATAPRCIAVHIVQWNSPFPQSVLNL